MSTTPTTFDARISNEVLEQATGRPAWPWVGVWSCVPVLAVLGFTGGTGLPGFPGVVSPIWMAVAFAGMAFSRIGRAPAEGA